MSRKVIFIPISVIILLIAISLYSAYATKYWPFISDSPKMESNSSHIKGKINHNENISPSVGYNTSDTHPPVGYTNPYNSSSIMIKFTKILGIVLTLSLILSITAYAADTTVTGSQLLNEFSKDGATDTTTVQSDTTISDDSAATIAGVESMIKADASNQSNYDIAATLFTKSKDKSIKIFAEGNIIDFSKYDNVLPVLMSGRTLVPIRALSEALGGNVTWDAATSLITITLGDTVIKLTLNQDTAYVNDKPVKLDVVAQSLNGRTLIPLRFVSENFSKKVDWHPYAGGASVISVIDK